MKKYAFLLIPFLLILVLLGYSGINTPSARAETEAAADTGAGSEAAADVGAAAEAAADIDAGSADSTEGTVISEDGLSVYCFSAGKADAFLFYTENGTVLIDCGVKGFGQTILDYMTARGIESIDYMIITHFDQDHVGGAAKVINNFNVKNVLQSNCPKDSTEYEKYLKALVNASIEPVTVSDTYEFTLDGVSYTVDPPHRTDYNNDDSNNSSLVIHVQYGDCSMLFTGDAQTERLEEMIETGLTDCDLLKVPHHGGEDDLMDELIDAVTAEYAVITSSEEEPESDTVVDYLEESGAEVFLTRSGPVLIETDGTELTVSYE